MDRDRLTDAITWAFRAWTKILIGIVAVPLTVILGPFIILAYWRGWGDE